MNILFTVLTNVVLAAVLVLGFFIGRKQGWKIALVNLVLTIGFAVGGYFAAGPLTNLILPLFNGIPAEALEVARIGIFGLGIVLIVALAEIITLAVEAIIFKVMRKHKFSNKMAGRKSAKITRHTAVVEDDKETRKAEKGRYKEFAKADKKEWKRTHKISRWFGAFIGIVWAAILVVVIYFPMGALGNKLKTVDVLDAGVENAIAVAYDNSLVGQVEDWILGKDSNLPGQLIK